MTPKGMLDIFTLTIMEKRIISTTDTTDEFTKFQKMISDLRYNS